MSTSGLIVVDCLFYFTPFYVFLTTAAKKHNTKPRKNFGRGHNPLTPPLVAPLLYTNMKLYEKKNFSINFKTV